MAQLTLDNWWQFDPDPNMVPLIWALTGRGFITKSSCGGHSDPNPDTAQRSKGEWYISFVATSASSIDALKRVLSAVDEYD